MMTAVKIKKAKPGPLDSAGRTPGERRKLIWCEKHNRPGVTCKRKRCRKKHPGLGTDSKPNKLKGYVNK